MELNFTEADSAGLSSGSGACCLGTSVASTVEAHRVIARPNKPGMLQQRRSTVIAEPCDKQSAIVGGRHVPESVTTGFSCLLGVRLCSLLFRIGCLQFRSYAQQSPGASRTHMGRPIMPDVDGTGIGFRS